MIKRNAILTLIKHVMYFLAVMFALLAVCINYKFCLHLILALSFIHAFFLFIYLKIVKNLRSDTKISDPRILKKKQQYYHSKFFLLLTLHLFTSAR